MTAKRMTALALLAGMIPFLAGCGTMAADTPLPTPLRTPALTDVPRPSAVPSPSPSPTAAASVESPAEAAARVFASDERWARMTPLRHDMIGQTTWFEAFEDGDGFRVEITVGAGDCMAGCIERRTWQYRVDRAGSVVLVSEEGDDIDVEQPAGGDGPALVNVEVIAGPTCPVETVPADPNCAPRPVEDAQIVVYAADGSEAARDTSDGNGMASLDVPGGAYYVVSEPVDGLMATPQAQAFAVLGGDEVGLLLSYDTGIR